MFEPQGKFYKGVFLKHTFCLDQKCVKDVWKKKRKIQNYTKSQNTHVFIRRTSSVNKRLKNNKEGDRREFSSKYFPSVTR